MRDFGYPLLRRSKHTTWKYDLKKKRSVWTATHMRGSWRDSDWKIRGCGRSGCGGGLAVTCSVYHMSLGQKLLSRRGLSQLGGTIRQVLASKSNDETIHVHGWVKSVRLQKRIAFAMIHDGTTPKGLQAIFRNPTQAKVSVCSSSYNRTPTYFLHKLDKWCKCSPHRSTHPKSRARSEQRVSCGSYGNLGRV